MTALAYLVLGCAWIWATGSLVGKVTSDFGELQEWERYKGLGFIFFTAAILYLWLRVIRRIQEKVPGMEHELRESRAQMASLLEYAPDAILIHDARHIAYANPAFHELFGIPKDCDLSRMNLRDVVAPGQLHEMNVRVARLASKVGTAAPMEVSFRTLQGRTIELEHASCSMVVDGRILVQSHLRDLTGRNFARRELERWNEHLEERVRERTAELSEANAALESFTYSVAHELRSPVGRIGGYAGALVHALERDDHSKISHYAARVEANAKQMSEMIDGLLMVSRTDRAELRAASIDMRALVSRCLRELGDGAVAVVQLGELPDALGDEALIREVWVNLVSNALKYSARSPAPRVAVSGEVREAECVFRVADNGIGFDDEERKRLFQTFERLANARDFAGTGIGLSVVKRIVLRHGGRVWAQGRPGEGAEFFFSLPRLLSS